MLLSKVKRSESKERPLFNHNNKKIHLTTSYIHYFYEQLYLQIYVLSCLLIFCCWCYFIEGSLGARGKIKWISFFINIHFDDARAHNDVYIKGNKKSSENIDIIHKMRVLSSFEGKANLLLNFMQFVRNKSRRWMHLTGELS